MKTLTDDETTKVLATCAGFHLVGIEGRWVWEHGDDLPVEIYGRRWESPDQSELFVELPDLAHSLDAQRKWVWPKFQDEGISINLVMHEHKGCSVVLTDGCSVVLTDVVHSDAKQIYRRGDDPADVCADAFLALLAARKKA